MKIICSRNQLLESIKNVSKAVSTKTTIPILSSILITTKPEHIVLTGNDMELGIETRMESIIRESGSIAVEPKYLMEFLGKVDGEDDIVLETEQNNTLVVRAGSLTFRVPVKDGADFVTLPEVEELERFTVHSQAFKEMIRRTIFATDETHSNPIVGGLNIELKGNRLSMNATDSYRIAIRRIQIEDAKSDVSAVVPKRGLNDLSKILPDGEDDLLSVIVSKNYIVFEYDETMLMTRLIDREYFPIQQMISKDYDKELRINRKEFMRVIEIAMILFNEQEKRPVVLDITSTPSGSNMEVRLNSSKGSMQEDLEIQAFFKMEEKNIKIGFNPKYILDVLRAIDDEEISVYMTNAVSPIYVRDAEENYIYLMLPLNFTE